MRKTRLSIPLWPVGFICPLIVCLCILIIVLRIANNDIFIGSEFSRLIIPPLLSLIVPAAITIWIFTRPAIEFDSYNLFIKRFGRKKFIVPMEKVLRLESTPAMMPAAIVRYSLDYKNEPGDTEQIKFWYYNQLMLFSFDDTVLNSGTLRFRKTLALLSRFL